MTPSSSICVALHRAGFEVLNYCLLPIQLSFGQTHSDRLHSWHTSIWHKIAKQTKTTSRLTVDWNPISSHVWRGLRISVYIGCITQPGRSPPSDNHQQSVSTVNMLGRSRSRQIKLQNDRDMVSVLTLLTGR